MGYIGIIASAVLHVGGLFLLLSTRAPEPLIPMSSEASLDVNIISEQEYNALISKAPSTTTLAGLRATPKVPEPRASQDQSIQPPEPELVSPTPPQRPIELAMRAPPAPDTPPVPEDAPQPESADVTIPPPPRAPEVDADALRDRGVDPSELVPADDIQISEVPEAPEPPRGVFDAPVLDTKSDEPPKLTETEGNEDVAEPVPPAPEPKSEPAEATEVAELAPLKTPVPKPKPRGLLSVKTDPERQVAAAPPPVPELAPEPAPAPEPEPSPETSQLSDAELQEERRMMQALLEQMRANQAPTVEEQRAAEAELAAKFAEEQRQREAEEARLAELGEAERLREQARLKAEEEKRLAALEAQRQAQAELERQAQADAQRRAELDAQRRAELDAQRRADLEAQRRAEAEAQLRAQQEARLAAQAEADRRAKELERARQEEEARRLAELQRQQRVQQLQQLNAQSSPSARSDQILSAAPSPQAAPAPQGSFAGGDAFMASILGAAESAAQNARPGTSFGAGSSGNSANVSLTPGETQQILTQLRGCWRVDAFSENAARRSVTLRAEVRPNGFINPSSIRLVSPNPAPADYRIAIERAQGALQDRSCQPFSLPQQKYAAWREIVIKFDPAQMVLQ